jgi:hypothetical protein
VLRTSSAGLAMENLRYSLLDRIRRMPIRVSAVCRFRRMNLPQMAA